MARVRVPAIERFWPKVDQSAGLFFCWKWTGGKTTEGYGAIRLPDALVYAHRFAYEHLVGPIPAGLTIDHLCRNRACVNPAHLEPVTRGENTRRSPLVGRNPNSHLPRAAVAQLSEGAA